MVVFAAELPDALALEAKHPDLIIVINKKEYWFMDGRSKYQQRAIKNYYDNRESIALQRAQELVTELYLAEGKKREKHWKSLAGHLEKLGVKKVTIDHLVAQDNPELVANLVKTLMQKA